MNADSLFAPAAQISITICIHLIRVYLCPSVVQFFILWFWLRQVRGENVRKVHKSPAGLKRCQSGLRTAPKNPARQAAAGATTFCSSLSANTYIAAGRGCCLFSEFHFALDCLCQGRAVHSWRDLLFGNNLSINIISHYPMSLNRAVVVVVKIFFSRLQVFKRGNRKKMRLTAPMMILVLNRNLTWGLFIDIITQNFLAAHGNN